MMSSEDLMNSEASSPSRVSALALCKAYGLVVSRTLGAYTSSQLNPFPSRSAVTSSQNWAVVVNRPGGNSVMLPRRRNRSCNKLEMRQSDFESCRKQNWNLF